MYAHLQRLSDVGENMLGTKLIEIMDTVSRSTLDIQTLSIDARSLDQPLIFRPLSRDTRSLWLRRVSTRLYLIEEVFALGFNTRSFDSLLSNHSNKSFNKGLHYPVTNYTGSIVVENTIHVMRTIYTGSRYF